MLISLVLADEDEGYAESMANFLISDFLHKFQVSSFTKKESIDRYFADDVKKTDILLISPGLYHQSLPLSRIGTLIILSNGRMPPEAEKYPSVNKYQHGEKFVNSILNIFCEQNPDEILEAAGGKKTKVVGVFSPSGGSGKTSIAVSCSLQCARKGQSVFYLNLESVSSTPLYFNCEGRENFSNILYYIKERSRNFTLKMEGTRCIDAEFDVHYFCPPDSIMEMQEISPEELVFLIQQMKFWGQYDYIFVDMSSSFDTLNIEILKVCDRILLVMSESSYSMIKTKTLFDQLDIIDQRSGLSISEKSTIVLNKCTGSGKFEIGDSNINTGIDVVQVVYDPVLEGIPQTIYLADNSGRYGGCIKELISKFE